MKAHKRDAKEGQGSSMQAAKQIFAIKCVKGEGKGKMENQYCKQITSAEQ